MQGLGEVVRVLRLSLVSGGSFLCVLLRTFLKILSIFGKSDVVFREGLGSKMFSLF